MKYCKKCIMPDTKPYITFNSSGVCSACLAHESKQKSTAGIDWNARKDEFEAIIQKTLKQKAPNYDVVVPVSGGKDSITQVHRALQYGMRVLAVNVDYGIKTEVGMHNLNLVAEMGANLLIYRPEQRLHKRLIKIGFEDFGDPDLLSHTLLHAYPLWAALKFEVPLVLLGEDSSFEYSGEKGSGGKKHITREWFSRYAANSGYDAKFVAKNYGIPFESLRFYDFPDGFEKSSIIAVFMSHYFYWDSEEHLRIAKKYGFKTLDRNREGTYRNYVGIDEKINRIHQYMKVLKFGYGRATDHACEDIRNGRITRNKAKELVRQYDTDELSDYYIDDFIKYLGYTKKKFYSILEKFRNKTIWKKTGDGNWYIQEYLEE